MNPDFRMDAEPDVRSIGDEPVKFLRSIECSAPESF